VPRGNAAALAQALEELLADPARRAELSRIGAEVAAAYDWQVLARRILAVYETVVPPGGAVVTATEDDDFAAVPDALETRSTLRRWVQR